MEGQHGRFLGEGRKKHPGKILASFSGKENLSHALPFSYILEVKYPQVG